MRTVGVAAVACCVLLAPAASCADTAAIIIGGEPNPPAWPDSVVVFHSTDSTADIEARVNAIFAENGGQKDNGEFSPDRYALLFMPGTYAADVPVGYYTQVLGLGKAATDVVFAGEKGVYCEEGNYDFQVHGRER